MGIAFDRIGRDGVVDKASHQAYSNHIRDTNRERHRMKRV